MIATALRTCSAALFLGTSFALAPAAAAPSQPGAPREFDWCAPVVSDPMRRYSPSNVCSQPYPLDELATGAEVLMMEGPELPEAAEGSAAVSGDPCRDEPSLAGHARYLRELRERARARGRTLFVTVKTRFDLVGPRLASRPGFEPGFLLRTDRPWSDVVGFFAADRSPDCARGGCRLEPADPAPDDGTRPTIASLRARVDGLAGPGASGSLVYYLSRGAPGQRVYRLTNTVADLRNPSYRSWRVREARRAIELGGYDAVMLNQKFHQYRPTRLRAASHWIASPAAPDVTRLNRLENTLWTAPPRGYGYSEYVVGWHALAADLRSAGVPYAVATSPAPWLGRHYEDPASDVDESALIRQATEGARLVLLDSPARRRGADFAKVVARLEQAGARVVPVDGSCGQPGARIGGARDAEAATPDRR